ncbi:Zn-dependent protease [Flavobacterium album]|uniref:Zn-dependent protease n=1 Tax=Flavobacterium album TaxID=2175091 RepID=A0A2S1QZC2_9FLAO|nr:zinc-dependent metalloprotease family protein [Flavobacterium album]AWH85767.1 Zn-dependent protease [Flavobacterium album]
MRRYILLITLLVLLSCSDKSVSETTIVGIIPYKGISDEKIAMLREAITEYYGIETKLLPEKELPKEAFIAIKSPRYRADSLIAIQQRNMPEGMDYILGLTESDISVTKKEKDGSIKKPEWKYNDFGIMGLAYCPGKSCIVSGFRLKHKDKEVHFGRFRKVVIHELGHNFGLPHCPNKKCVMTDAVEKIATIDNARPELCEDCKKKLDI